MIIRFSKYTLWFLMFACIMPSCDMSRFYAAKRIGKNHPVVTKEAKHLAGPGRPEISGSLPSDQSKDTLPGNVTQTEESLPQTALISQNTVSQKVPVQRKNKVVLNLNITKQVHEKLSLKEIKENGEFWLVFIYILLCCLSLGLVVFLFAWILSPIMVALRIALWTMLGLFVFLVLAGLFLGFTMGDRHNPVKF